MTSPVAVAATQPTLLTLPYCVVKYLLLYLDVESLENLSQTCSYFDQMIAGKFLTSIDFPFPAEFIREVNGTDGIDKKPLLRLNCKKTRKVLKIFPDMPDDYSEPISFHNLIVDSCPHTTDYLVMSQLSLLSLHRLREVDLVPESMKQELHSSRFVGQRVMDSYMSFDSGLLRQISRYFHNYLWSIAPFFNLGWAP